MLDDFTRNAWHVQGFPHKDVSTGAEEADERAFLFGGKHGANAHHFALSTGSKDPADRLGSGASLTASSLMVASSLEATIAAA